MQKRIRVLVVDDAVVIRRLLSDVLGSDPQLEVVGTAANGRIALAKVKQLQPDLVTLDVEMPEMDGLEALAAIRKEMPGLPVIMFSSLTERGASVTLEALAKGANDYVTKPANVGSVVAGTESIREQLIPRIKAFCANDSQRYIANADQSLGTGSTQKQQQRIDIVTIGVSTGGPNALEKLIPALPADFPAAITIVQHMPPIFTKTLAQRLCSISRIPVHEAANGDLVQRGVASLAPGGYHMFLTREIATVHIQTDQSPAKNSCRPSVDVLFQSVAAIYGARALAVVLTGMGEDGVQGCRAIREAGGQVIVQDQETSVVWGMPGNVAMAGLANNVLPLDGLAPEIVRRVRVGRL